MPCHFDQNPQDGVLLIQYLHAVVIIYGAENKPVVQLGDNYGRSRVGLIFREIRGMPQVHHALCGFVGIWTVTFTSPKGRVSKLKKSRVEDEINSDRSKES
jgi:hypothetical protein